ncbi:hypothetical protein, partial [Ruminococcus sp.]|uniref:hypothetical protein n=1 Tax=Ruminococcus sp. TaxID=41978 RepID=UPI0025DDEF2E
QGQRPWSPPQRRNTPAHTFAPRRKGVRKATAFRGESEQDRFPLFPIKVSNTLKTFQWNVFNAPTPKPIPQQKPSTA